MLRCGYAKPASVGGDKVFYLNFFLMLLNVIMQVSRRKYGTSGDERNVVE